jgi:hypothetical protein
MDEPKGLKELALIADSIATAVWYFLLFAARYSLTSALLISIAASPIIGGLLGGLSSRARRGQLKAKGAALLSLEYALYDECAASIMLWSHK